MFGWLRPTAKCPISSAAKEVIETRFAWIADGLGIERLRTSTLVLPTTEFFPGKYHHTLAEIEDLKDRVAKFLGVSPHRVAVHFYSESEPYRQIEDRSQTIERQPGYDFPIEIWLERQVAADPLLLVASIAMEIAFVLVLDELRFEGSQEAAILFAELLTVYLGMGIVTANESVQESAARMGHISWWRMSRSTCLSLNDYGYALALYALSRGETRPKWASHLRSDVAGAMRQAIRYLQETGESDFPHLLLRL